MLPRKDIVDWVTILNRRTRAMETRALWYYEDPSSGVTDGEPTNIACGPSWSTRSFGIQGQVIADTVTMIGPVRPNLSPPSSTLVCVVPERLRPSGTVYRSFRHRDIVAAGSEPLDVFLMLNWIVEPNGEVHADTPDWHSSIGWYTLGALSWPFEPLA